jgi:hypothetical protein
MRGCLAMMAGCAPAIIARHPRTIGRNVVLHQLSNSIEQQLLIE